MEWDRAALAPNWDKVIGLELYDHSQSSQLDNSYFDQTENQNIARAPSNAGLLMELQVRLKQEVQKWLD